MATASVNDNRVEVTNADSTTGWTQGATNTTTYAENGTSITAAIDTTSDSIYYDGATYSLATYPLVYVWTANIAEQGTWKPATTADTPHGLLIGDGTNRLVLMNSGVDREVFKHQETQTVFQCMLVDEAYLATKNTNSEIYVENGTFASFVETSVEEFGAYYTTLAKAFKGWNCGCDIIRIGGYGDYVEFYGGTSGDPIDFNDCVVQDRDPDTDGRGLGIIREYTANTYGCQGRLGIGYTSATHFEQSGFVLIFEDRDVSDLAYGINFNHSTTATPFTTIIMKSGTIGSAGPGVEIEDSGTERLELTLEGMTFNNLKNALMFPENYYGGAGSITGCVFNGCGQIHPGPSTFEGNSITNTTTGADSGAVLIDTLVDTANWSDNIWTYGGGATEAAIHITAAGSYTFTNLTFSGYGANDTNTAAIYNDSGGQVTITNSGSTGITVRNETGSTTTVQASATTTVTVSTQGGTPIENARVYLEASNGTGPLPYQDTVTITRSGTTVSVSHTAHGMPTGKQVAIRGADQPEYNGVWTISNVTTNGYDYTIAGTPTTPATGTIQATGVLIHGLTSALGVISDTRSLGTDQPVAGHSRKSTSSPFYKSSAIVGTVDGASGSSFTAVMIADE